MFNGEIPDTAPAEYLGQGPEAGTGTINRVDEEFTDYVETVDEGPVSPEDARKMINNVGWAGQTVEQYRKASLRSGVNGPDARFGLN